MKIRFRSIKAIEEFLDIVNRFSAEIDIKSKRTTVDGKSMMGIFSLDLSNPVEVTAIGCYATSSAASASFTVRNLNAPSLMRMMRSSSATVSPGATYSRRTK